MTIIATVPGPAHLRPLRARLLDAVVARIVALHDADPTGLRRHIQSAVRQEFAAQLGARRLVALEPGEVGALIAAGDIARAASTFGEGTEGGTAQLRSALAQLRDDAHGPGSSASSAQVRASTLRDDVAAIARRTDAAGPAGPSGPSDSPTHG